MGSSFGQLFHITTFGESHGGGVGVVIDGCPPRISLSEPDIQRELDRRRPGQSAVVSQRNEADRCEILSGVFEGQTLGTPIAIVGRNEDAQPEAYREIATTFRPSHADFTYEAKYGIRNWQGGGRASARETIGRVAAGAVARQVLAVLHPGLEFVTYVTQMHDLAAGVAGGMVKREHVEAGPVGTPEAALSQRTLRWPAPKGFETGSGFAASTMKGSEHNDPFEIRDGEIRTTSNHSGGVQGGISNGESIIFRVAFKPTATIARRQRTVPTTKEDASPAARARPDPCVLPRAVPMVEAMAALVLCDHALRQRAIAASAVSGVTIEDRGPRIL